MKFKKKYIIIILVLVGLIYFLDVFGDIQIYNARITSVYQFLFFCIINNDGKFPESEEGLIKKGILRKKVTPKGIIYEWTDKPDEIVHDWYEMTKPGEFKIAYGININDIKLVNEKLFGFIPLGDLGKRLYSKEDNIDIFLIAGPKDSWMHSYIDRGYSLYLYDLMLEVRQKAKTKNQQPVPENK